MAMRMWGRWDRALRRGQSLGRGGLHGMSDGNASLLQLQCVIMSYESNPRSTFHPVKSKSMSMVV